MKVPKMRNSINVLLSIDGEKIMGVEEAIRKLETSNQGLTTILENLDEQFKELRSDPRLEGLVDDLEHLFLAYLKTWVKTNSELLGILKKESTGKTPGFLLNEEKNKLLEEINQKAKKRKNMLDPDTQNEYLK